MLCNYFFKMPYKKGFSVKKRFKKEKLNKSKRLQAFKEHDNNKNIVQVNLLKLYYLLSTKTAEVYHC